ncbi:MAG: GGDEF domain-containing protein [Chloroflexi bacterium]|nr:GGDEF domain-containing protein [Chloroflexota bacterium]
MRHSLSPEALSSTAAERSGVGRRQPATQRGTAIFVCFMAPLVLALVCWSLWGGRWVPSSIQQAIELGGIVLIGVTGLILASYVRHRNVQIERAYSTHLEELSQRLRSLAYQDSLTDLYNHRYFYEQLSHEVERAQRYGRPVSVILLDLDNFKQVNDTYGHLMGDKLLALMGQVIKDQVRASDIAARYGGDEFAIILPDTPRPAAEATAEKLSRAIATGRTNAGSMSENLPLSASFGVACCPDESRTVSELLQLADDRVYAAKAARSSPQPLAAAE